MHAATYCSILIIIAAGTTKLARQAVQFYM